MYNDIITNSNKNKNDIISKNYNDISLDDKNISKINNDNLITEKSNDNNIDQENKKLNYIIQGNNNSKKETIEDLLNKTLTKKKLDPIQKKANYDSNINLNNTEEIIKDNNLTDNYLSTPNLDIIKYLKDQIHEKMEKISELSLSQDTNKKTLTELLQKLNHAIRNNAELLYSGEGILGYSNVNENENKIDKKAKIGELRLLLENKKKELVQSKEKNENYKNKYNNLIKDYKVSSNSKMDIFHKQINTMKNNNLLLNKKIKILNTKTHLEGKKLDLNSKIKNNNEIKKFSDEYTTLMKEKYKHYMKLNNNKKLIKDALEQFQYLMKMINREENEKKNDKEKDKILDKIKNLKLEEEINNLKEDLSGNEETIYNRVISDKAIILEKYKKINKSSSIIMSNNKNYNNKKSINKIRIKLISKDKNVNENNKNKKILNSKSCDDFNAKEKIYNNINNINDEDININYETMTNSDYDKIKEKNQKYFNLDERLDKSIKELSLFYERKIKEINSVLDINSKQLSNIQQENELLKSKIADLGKILESNKKEKKQIITNFENINSSNNKNLNGNEINEFDIKNQKLENYENGSNIPSKKGEIKIKNIKLKEREKYIEKIKAKYKVKRSPISEDNININEFE